MRVPCKFIIPFLISLIPCLLSGQSFQAFKKAGDQAFQTRDYNAAMHYYKQALEKKTGDVEVNYQYADAALAFSSYEIAEKHFKKVNKLDKANLFPTAHFKLGLVYKTTERYEQAVEQFNLYLNTQPSEQEKQKTTKHIAACGHALEWMKESVDQEVVHLGRSINTAYSEFGALKRGDTLYYSSFRFNNKEDKMDPPRKIAKTLVSVRNGRGRLLRKFNAEAKHTVHTAISLDGNRIYYNVCDYGKGLEIKCALFYKEKDSRGRWKKTGKALPDTINLKGYTTTQPCIGYDTISKKEILFFASDRPGGKGGMDIWKSVIKNKRSFSDPEPVMAINTTDNEITPFFDNVEQRLFFSSDRPESMGGYDIFFLDFQKHEEKIQQLTPPLNSGYNDIYFTNNGDGETGYLSSNRPGTFYLDKSSKACCNDIYYYKPKPPEPEPDSTVLVTISVDPIAEPVEEPTIEKVPETLQDFLPLALYFDNDEPDKRTRRTETRKNYADTFWKYIDKKPLFMESFAEPLEEEQKEEAGWLVEIFFEREVKKGYDHLMLFSEILLERLEKGEEVEIFIKGFTSPRAQSDYNLALGKRRVSCLKNHFDDYQAGIFRKYISSGALKITERSFGETSAASGISDALEDLRNSVYSPAASRERRVEIVEIQVGID